MKLLHLRYQSLLNKASDSDDLIRKRFAENRSEFAALCKSDVGMMILPSIDHFYKNMTSKYTLLEGQHLNIHF